jgi:hypothetical protein
MGPLFDLLNNTDTTRKRFVRLTFVCWGLAFASLALSIRALVALYSGGIWLDHGVPIPVTQQWHYLIGFGCVGILFTTIAVTSRRYW